MKTTMKSGALLATAVLALAPAFATDYPAANVSALHSALGNALPGDNIVMQDGTWTNADIRFDGTDSDNGTGGTPGNPITLKAQTPGSVILNGTSRLRIAGEYMVVSGLSFENGSRTSGSIIEFRDGSSNLASNCTLTDCAIVDYNPPSATTDYDWVGIYGLNNTVEYCRFSGMNHIGVQMVLWLGTGAQPDNTVIRRNHFDGRALGTGNGFETIRIGTSDVSQQTSNALVEYNLFEECNGEIEIISNKSVGNTYRGNTFLRCNGQLTLRHGGDCLVEGNFFLGENVSGSSGVRIIGPDHVVVNNYFQDLAGTGTRAAISMMNGVPSSPLNRYLRVEDCVVAFNTIVNCEETFVIGVESSEGDTTLAPQNCTIANNVVYTTEAPIIEYENTPVNFTYEGNFMAGASLGITPPGGISTSDPQLTLAGDGLWRPGGGSPVLGAAAGSYPTVTTDMDGQSRPGTGKDSGADQASGDSIVFAPLDAADVGPRWAGLAVELSGFSVY